MAKKRSKDPLKEYIIQKIASEVAVESERLHPYVCAIFRFNSHGHPEQFGSGVFICIGEFYFLITARHVLENKDEFGVDNCGKSVLYIPDATGVLQELVEDYHTSKTDDGDPNKDPTDIGIIRLESDLVEMVGRESFLSVSEIDVNDTGNPTAIYSAMGYLAKSNGKLNFEKKTLKRQVFNYAANISIDKKLSEIDLTSGSHLLIEYKKRHSRDLGGRDLTAPDPHGTSGGALWRYEVLSGTETHPRLIGIIIEWIPKLRGVLVVRMPIVLGGIKHLFPELAALIPNTNTANVTIADTSKGNEDTPQ